MYCVPCARKINEHNTPGLVHIPKQFTLWVVDDCEYTRTAIPEDLASINPLARVETFNELFDTRANVIGPDVLIIDISAVAPIAAGAHQAYSPICSFHERFPGCTIWINSAVGSGYADTVQELVKEHCPQCDIRVVQWGKCDPFAAIRTILTELSQ